jgi:hypothetical protein
MSDMNPAHKTEIGLVIGGNEENIDWIHTQKRLESRELGRDGKNTQITFASQCPR